MSDLQSTTVIFVLGGPGAGKGTQCSNLVKDFDFVHLSAGDLLREEMNKEGSEVGQMISQYIKDGLIVPMEVTIKLIENAIRANLGKMVLLDGFPRKMDQGLKFEESVVKPKAVLYFLCDEPTMRQRLLKRGETSGRSDDNEESIVKRFHTFENTSYPVVEHYKGLGKVIEVDTRDTPENVYKVTKEAIENLLKAEDSQTGATPTPIQVASASSCNLL